MEVLKKSIEKRENLLRNQNFVQKAPENLVEEETEKLYGFVKEQIAQNTME